MEKFKDFFSELVRRSGLSSAEISRRTIRSGRRVAESSISSALDGKRGFSVETINSLAPVLKLSDQEKQKLIILAWAFREKGEAELTTLELLNAIDKNGALKPTTRPIKTEVPVWENIKAGSSDLTEQTATIHGVTGMTESEIREGYFCMLVSGDSMEGELIYDGDIAVFAPAGRDFVERDIYAVEVEGYPVWMIKKLRPMPAGKVALISANPKHEPIVIDPTTTSIALKGRLVRTIRERGKSYSV
jgi:SOS-response transcriptional repressor LexA